MPAARRGAVVAAGWYVTGHLGYGENPDTLETVYHATNTRTLESFSYLSAARSGKGSPACRRCRSAR
jgi:hypothetical protein